MSGYWGYSMSNNAREAYKDGEKPLSKWTKKSILEEIENLIETGELEISLEKFNKIKKLKVKALKEYALTVKSWHHTSSWYNATDFYGIDCWELENCEPPEEIEEKIEEKTTEMWECTFLEWSGTRNHPKAKEITEIGEVRGDWFYRKNGTKKSTKTNGFVFVKKIEE